MLHFSEPERHNVLMINENNMKDDLAADYSIRQWLSCLRQHPPVTIRRSALCPACGAKCSRFKIALNNSFYQYKCPACATVVAWSKGVELVSSITWGMLLGFFPINKRLPASIRIPSIVLIVLMTIFITRYFFLFLTQVQTKKTSEQ
jgi:hypothetical protein